MAVDKLKEGIDGFAKDQVKLEAMVHEITEGKDSCKAEPSEPQCVTLRQHAAAPICALKNDDDALQGYL